MTSSRLAMAAGTAAKMYEGLPACVMMGEYPYHIVLYTEFGTVAPQQGALSWAAWFIDRKHAAT